MGFIFPFKSSQSALRYTLSGRNSHPVTYGQPAISYYDLVETSEIYEEKHSISAQFFLPITYTLKKDFLVFTEPGTTICSPQNSWGVGMFFNLNLGFRYNFE